jgi:hypothetical protein
MPDAAFQEVFDWLADHKGKRVWIEIGQKDPQAEQQADFAALGLHATLGVVRTVKDTTHARRALRVVIGDDEESGIEIDEARFERAKIHGGALKVWQHDIYIAVREGQA